MKNIIYETEEMAYDYLKAFGFSEKQVDSLVTQGKKDLEKELMKLETLLLYMDTVSLEDINNVLHALKGLFSQMGNHDVAGKLNEIRSQDDRDVTLKEVSQMLFCEK